MLFCFNVNLSDKDYFDYNSFWMTKSPYGKKQLTQTRSILTALFAVIFVLTLASKGFSTDTFISLITYFVLFCFLQLTFKPLVVWMLKIQISSLKKKGKMGYSAVSTLEFFDDRFVETTPTNKTEQQYSSIERISIIEDKILYIHVNNIMSYLLPFSCFESTAQRDSFLEFIKTKCAKIDIYKKN